MTVCCYIVRWVCWKWKLMKYCHRPHVWITLLLFVSYWVSLQTYCWWHWHFCLSEHRVQISGFITLSLYNSIGEWRKMCCYWIECILYFKSILCCSKQAWILHYSVALLSISICSCDCIRRHLDKPWFVIIELLAIHFLLNSLGYRRACSCWSMTSKWDY